MDDTKAFLGRGFAFPPQIDQATGRFVMCSDEEDIRQSIYIILMTKKRERAMLPDFGCDLHDHVFDLTDPMRLAMLRREIVEALARWEPRIIDVDVKVDQKQMQEGKLVFDIRYTVRSTNNPNNLVFPYYMYEGVGLE